MKTYVLNEELAELVLGYVKSAIYAEKSLESVRDAKALVEAFEATASEDDDANDDAFTRGVALALAEIHAGQSIKMTLESCGIYTVDDLRDAQVDDFDIDRLVKYLD